MLLKNKPRWIILPIAFLLVASLTAVGLGMVIAVQAAAPGAAPQPSPTAPAIAYAAHLSTDCADCHVDMEKLDATGAGKAEVERVYIDPASTHILHGRLGCVTCHGGTPDTTDAETAHANMLVDPSMDQMQMCLSCHDDLSNEIVESQLIVPHDLVASGMAEELACSDCHGAVGHSLDLDADGQSISMAECLDCHEERQLEVQQENCDSCHTVSPAWTPQSDCTLCHDTTYDESMQNPDLLGYAHQEQGLECLDCHETAHMEEAHVGAVPGARVPHLNVDIAFCTDCHVENNHASYEQVIGLTTGYVFGDQAVNPHDPHANAKNPPEVIECRTCHRVHDVSTLENGCFNCHHSTPFEACGNCHEGE